MKKPILLLAFLFSFQSFIVAQSGITLMTCKGEPVDIQSFSFSTDQPGFVLDLSSCLLSNNDLTSYINCIVENNNLLSSSSISLNIESPDNYLQDISSLDMIFILKGILGIDPLDNYCSLIAADVNNDSFITAIDIITMRKLILGIYSEFPFSPAWKFISKLPTNPAFITIEDIDLNFKVSEFPLLKLEPIAIKIGDVSGNTTN